MKKAIKIAAWTAGILIAGMAGSISVFVYKVKYGFPVSYERDIPRIQFPEKGLRVLLFSKSTGFRHDASIESGKKKFAELAEQENWFLFSTENGGVFNPGQLREFQVVVFNNCTGRLLDEDQQYALQQYIEGGGRFVGIHGAGDDSHHWPWYEQNLIGVPFSHHALTPQFQSAAVSRHVDADSILARRLPDLWEHADEWYVFTKQPAELGFKVLYSIDGDQIDTNGNMLWVTDKDFGMGKQHPVAWHKEIGEGHTFYTSLGHDEQAWKKPVFVQMITNAVQGKQ